jgi:hypothetical protein
MQIFTPVTHTDLKAYAESLRLWLLEIAVWMVEAIGFGEGRRALHEMRLEARRDLRELIFLMMCARLRFRKTDKRRRWMRPPSAPAGFCYAHRRIDMVRLYTRGIALKTFAQMRRALDDLERIVERAIARVPKGVCTGRLVIRSADDLVRVRCREGNVGGVAHAPDTS